jgi:hypothetical protein
MTILLLAWLSIVGLPVAPPLPVPRPIGAQDAHPLRLDIRVFDATNEVTADTIVSLYDAGTRANARRVPLAPNGERQLPLPAGQYDLQLLHQDDGRVLRVRWTSLRLLAPYPGEHGQHLEVFNMQPGFGALQVRRAAGAAEQGSVSWAATLRPAGGGEPIGSPIRGDGYVVFVAPPGRYDVEIRTREGQTRWIRNAEIREDLTYLQSWGD